MTSQHIKTLIIDNYDSYTFNLLQLFDHDQHVIVIRNDQFTWTEFTEKVLPHFDNVIISPGPGRPERSQDFGLCGQLLAAQLDPLQPHNHRPIFGVCLGHQGIGYLFGGDITYAPRIMHGRMSQVHHSSTVQATYRDILNGCASPFWAVRYHSLVVDLKSLPKDLLLTAYCYENDADMDALKNSTYLSDQQDTSEQLHHFLDHISEQTTNEVTVMAFQHKTLPMWGVQFHPESVSTEYGHQMMMNFQQQTLQWMQQVKRPIKKQQLDGSITAYSASIPHSIQHKVESGFELLVKTSCPSWVDPEALVDELLSTQRLELGWLDSSRRNSPYSQLSVLSTQPAVSFSYSTLHKQLDIKYRDGTSTSTFLKESFFDYTADLLQASGSPTIKALDKRAATDLEFEGGLMGYFGYEMKRESMEGYTTPKEQLCHCTHQQHVDHCCKCVEEPDAAFQFIDRFLVFDLQHRQIYICCLVQHRPERHAVLSRVGFHDTAEASAWIGEQERTLLQVAESIRRRKLADEYTTLTPASSACSTPVNITSIAADVFTPDVQHEPYLKTIEQCIENIRQGEAYELCLTTRFRLDLPKHMNTEDPTLYRLYTRHLRKNNPAPFSALIMFPNLDILSSSPERFLKVNKDHVAEMKPIKGTVARVLHCVCSSTEDCDFDTLCQQRQTQANNAVKQLLWQDVKERAENLMIVDLIRNDLSQVCEPHSVRVPKLMHVESYEKVHHLVSTIRGDLYPAVSSVKALQVCFPPGSMTGAPKLRSVQILDGLENHKPRGIYSGCLGYFSLNGSADFNVVIRTAVAATLNDAVQVSVGGGGAITFLSDPECEWKETLLKTKSVAPSVKEFLEDQ